MKKLLWIMSLVVVLTGCYQMLPPSIPNSQQPTYRIAWPWDSATVYAKGEVVTMPVYAPGGPIYESLQGNNIGIQPPTRIGSEPDIYGKEGDQLPMYTPTVGWENWWKLAGLQE